MAIHQFAEESLTLGGELWPILHLHNATAVEDVDVHIYRHTN